MPVDPWGRQDSSDDDSYYVPSWQDIISQTIHEGAQTAQIAEAGYPPGTTVVYSPTTQYPQYPSQQQQPGVAPHQQGIQLSQTTLMLLVGGVLLFMLGGRKR